MIDISSLNRFMCSINKWAKLRNVERQDSGGESGSTNISTVGFFSFRVERNALQGLNSRSASEVYGPQHMHTEKDELSTFGSDFDTTDSVLYGGGLNQVSLRIQSNVMNLQ